MGRVHHEAFLLLALVSAAVAPGLSGPQKGNEREEPLKLSTQLVVVDAQVLGKTGTPVDELSERDFVLFEEGVRAGA